MYEFTINEMIEKLVPALGDPELARELLNEYWEDKIADVWTVGDVLTEADNTWVCSDDKAKEILMEWFKSHSAEYGLTWDSIRDAISENCPRFGENPVGSVQIYDDEELS